MPEIDINLRTSKFFLSFAVLFCTATFLVACCVTLPITVKVVVLLITLIYSGCIIWRTVLRKTSREIQRVSYNGKAWIFQDQKRTFSAQILGESTLTQLFCILRCVRVDKQKITCLIFRDMMTKSQYRKLLIALKTREEPVS